MLAVPAMAAIAVYLPALSGGFLSDDYSLLHTFYGADARELAARVGKTFVSGVGPPSNQYRPLTMASFALNTYFSGANAAAWRLVNVLLHGANAALVALLAWQLAGAAARDARSAALAAGLAFAWFAPSVRGRCLGCGALRRDVPVQTCRLLWTFQVLGLVRRGQATEEAQAEDRRERESELDVEDVVERLNQTLSRVYSFLRGRMGEDVDRLFGEALGRTQARYESLFYDMDLRQYGRADFDQMLANVADLPAAERRSLIVAGLKDLLASRPGGGPRASEGAEEEVVVSGIIKDGLRRIGAA